MNQFARQTAHFAVQMLLRLFIATVVVVVYGQSNYLCFVVNVCWCPASAGLFLASDNMSMALFNVMLNFSIGHGGKDI
jgi:hypothetical protein